MNNYPTLNKIYILIYIIILILIASNVFFIYKFDVANDSILALNLENSNLKNKLLSVNTSDNQNVSTTEDPIPEPKKRLSLDLDEHLNKAKELTKDYRESKQQEEALKKEEVKNVKPREQQIITENTDNKRRNPNDIFDITPYVERVQRENAQPRKIEANQKKAISIVEGVKKLNEFIKETSYK